MRKIFLKNVVHVVNASLIRYAFVVNAVVLVHVKIVVVVVATKMDVNVNAIQKKILGAVIAAKVAAAAEDVEVPQKVLVVEMMLILNMIKGVI